MQLTDNFIIVSTPGYAESDPGCITRLADGDRDAFAWVYKNYYRRIYNYAMLMTRNVEQSEDIAQEVFFKLWQNREKIRAVKNFDGYLYALSRNYVWDILKRQQKEIQVRHLYHRSSEVEKTTVHEIFSYKQGYQWIARTAKQLPKQQRLIYKLSRDCGWTHGEIAEKMKISKNTVKGQLQNAIKFLKEKIR